MNQMKMVYTVPELARLMGLSRFRVARLLKTSNVQVRRSGRSILVFAAEIRKAMPDLWESLQEHANLS